MISFNNLGNYGRLGNQMFQYAALKGIAANRGYNICIPAPHQFGTRDGNVARSDSNLWNTFKISCQVVGVVDTIPTISESCHHFDEVLFNTCLDNINLEGYFQTEKYFKHIESEIRNDFTFHDIIIDQSKQYLSHISGEIIALHIRRGDYVNLQQFHPIPQLSYYQAALQQLPQVKVLVFSDDIEWCRQQHAFSTDQFCFSKDNTTAVDLCLMSICDYHVIANSSFSWWGAWLANSKQVIAPKQWFGPSLAYKNTADVYCDGWIKL